MTFHAKMSMSDLQRYPWRLYLIMYELDIHVLVLKTVYFYFWFLRKRYLSMFCGEMVKINYFLNHKNEDIFHIIDQIKVLRILLWIKYSPLLQIIFNQPNLNSKSLPSICNLKKFLEGSNYEKMNAKESN